MTKILGVLLGLLIMIVSSLIIVGWGIYIARKNATEDNKDSKIIIASKWSKL